LDQYKYIEYAPLPDIISR